MRRREFITLFGGVAAWPTLGQGQQSPPLIAILGSGSADAPSSVAEMREIADGMRALALVEGRDYVFETWWANSDSSRFPALADALLARHPAAVVVFTGLAVTAGAFLTLAGESRWIVRAIVGTSVRTNVICWYRVPRAETT